MNFRRILSKSSLRSSSSSGKSLTQSEEVTKLKSEIELLKQTIDLLKVSADSRDAAIGTLAREKEKLYVELKSAQRTNRNLHQQLVDERVIHSKEKEFLINEMRRISQQPDCNINPSVNMVIDALIEDQPKYSINDELKAKDEVIFNIGTKYFKIKSSKMLLRKKIESLQIQNKQSFEDIVALLTDNKRYLDRLLDKLVKCSTVSPGSKKYLKLLQSNGNLHYENTQLKIHLSSQKEYVKSIPTHLLYWYNNTDELEQSLPILNERNKSARCILRLHSNNTLSKLHYNGCSKGYRNNSKSVSSFHGVPKSFSDSCILKMDIGKDFSK